ncbi:EFR1 family ferrodoxin [Anaerovorax odorimutans]|uniref:EFR1 family ferrodoxin n=1 Tax=Anaerovorax odorimutans TaxID=109327 RepID=A0ABT1RRD3_9FIRM|nr:EFR1 family ferrodoxin [Anaerovorax odorimutans]MCQ4637737.1 EFR1 family ferrodoxin [Anaerovorax odorimutans]
MVFYFSGTGNSQLAAKQIAEQLGDELVSINQHLKDGEKKTFRSQRPLVFVAPVYAWRVPKVVEKWICDMEFEGNKNAYFVLTRGGSTGGNAAAYAKKLCDKTGMVYQGLASVHMPENYIALSSAPSESECESIIARAKPVFSQLASQIRQGEPFTEASVSLADRLISGPVNVLYYRFFIKDKGFTVSDACISCGKCTRRCPLNNIDMVDGKPAWKGNCTHCMACICGCPTEAIEYKSISKGKRRYDIMEE